VIETHEQAGFKAKVRAEQFEAFKDSYTDDLTVTRAGRPGWMKPRIAMCMDHFCHA